jgi:hypothetical protein
MNRGEPVDARSAATSSLALMDDYFRDEPRTPVPLVAPMGVEADVATFLEVCSRAVFDMPAGIGEATRRGWTADPAVMAAAVVTGMVILTADGGLDGRRMLQITKFDYPHVSGANCMINQFSDGVPESFDVSPFKALKTVRGSESALPAGLGPGGMGLGGGTGGVRGSYSFVTPEGDVVSITVLHAPPTLLQMNMATSRARLPTPDAAAPKP